MATASLERARALIDAEYATPLDLDELARTAHFSRYYFLRAFRRAYHATPHEYLTRKRIVHGRLRELVFADRTPIRMSRIRSERAAK